MKAVDTNVLVRLIARDDADQLASAEELIRSGDILVLPTVLLETEWVLRAHYRVERGRIVAGLGKVCGLHQVLVLSEAAVRSAINAYEAGRDFADALHVALAAEQGALAFATFDKGVVASSEMVILNLSAPRDS